MSTGTSGLTARRERYGHASKVDRDAATKQTTVEFVAKADDEQVVTGVVMVPNAVDRQGDFETPETIERFADDFAALYENESADGGIMHAAWPSEWMALDANAVVGRDDVPDDIADADLPEGAWVQSWRVEDDGLWGLIDDEIIQGFSIGARDVTWRGPMEQADLPEGVGVPEEYGEDQPVWELVDGVVREVSAVDTPAVPDAMILAKDDAEKALDEYLGDRAAFLDELKQRGHSDADAERMWDVMSRAADVDGSESPGKESFFSRIGKAAWSAVAGDDGPTDDASGAEHQTRTDKEGRTLSRQNRESLFATIDASLDVLENAGVNHGMSRFTDRDEWAFDLSEHRARTWTTADDDGTDDDTEDEDDTDTTESMTDTDTDDDNPVLAEVKALREDMEELKSDADGDDADGKDANDDTDATKSDLTEAVETLNEEVKSLKETAESNADAIENIGKQAGFSTQVSGEGDDTDGGAEKGLDSVAEILG